MNNYNFECANCKKRCDGKSKNEYFFESDAEYSEMFEKEIINKINSKKFFKAIKTSREGYPDIEIYDSGNCLIKYIEVKVQRRTFMSVKKCLPNSDLIPSNTVALNLSDLERYFRIRKKENKKIYILWVVSNRSCINNGNETYFLQDIDVLFTIYKKYGNARRFRRNSGKGDIVDGKHKGVVVNYHFSLSELELVDIFDIDKFL